MSRGDVISLTGGRAGEVVNFWSDLAETECIVQMHMYRRHAGRNSFEVEPNVAWISTDEVVGPMPWAKRVGNVIQVILPPDSI